MAGWPSLFGFLSCQQLRHEMHYAFNRLEKLLMATKDEVVAKLDAIGATIEKVSGETSALVQLVSDLQDAAAGNVPDDIVAKIDALAERINAVDALVQDAAPSDPV